MLSHRKGVLLDGIGSELVRASTGGVRKTLSKWLGDLSNAINLGDVASTFTSGDATPSVLNNSKFITAGSTAITNFDDGVEGQTITVYRGASDISITDNATIDPIIAGNLTLSTARPSATFRLASGVWKQVEESGAASTALIAAMQAATVNAASTILGNVTDSPISISATPVTNPAFATLSGNWLTGETNEENKREFLDSVEFISSMGSTEATNLQDKVARFTAMQMKPGSGDGWAENGLLVIQSGVGSKNGHGYELDINNANIDYGNTVAIAGMAAPTLIGHHVTGFSSKNTTAAYAVSMAAGSTGFHNRGYVVGQGAITATGAAFENQDDCAYAFVNYGNPTYVLYSQSATSDMSVVGNTGLGGLPAVGFKLTIQDTGAARQGLTGTTQALYRFRDTGATDNFEIIDIDVDGGVVSFLARNNDGTLRVTPLSMDTSTGKIAIASGYGASAAEAKDTTDTTHLLTPANLLDVGAVRVLWKLTAADMNSTADQAFTKVGTFTTWMLVSNGCIRAVQKTGTTSIAAGGIYTATSKGGDALVAAGTAWSALAGVGTGANASGTALGNGLRSDTALWLSLTTGAGSAQTADIFILGIPIS